MAHEVETMAFAEAGGVPWHGLGSPLSGAGLRDWRVACREAGLEWEAVMAPLAVQAAPGVPALTVGRVVDRRAVVRAVDGKVIGTVGADFVPLQNRDAFAWFAPIVEAGLATFEAAGSLRGGSRVWALARVGGLEAEVKPGDSVRRYVLLAHAHDGTLAVRVGVTDTRVVCMNTLRAAIRSELSQLIRIRHTSSVKANLDAVRDVLDAAAGEFRATVAQYRKLLTRDVSREDVTRYVELVLDVADREAAGELATRTKHRVDEIVRLAYEGKGAEGSTYWDAYNAVTEFNTWHQGRSRDNRLNSTWFGGNAKVNERALEVALELVG